VVARRLGRLPHPVHEGERRREVGQDEVAHQCIALDAPVVMEFGLILGHVRIVSLVPSATEMLFALGLGGEVIAVTHECDFPPEAEELPSVTKDVLPPGLTAAEIDAAVEERTTQGEAIYELDVELLHELEPDLIVTQGLCAVCAVSVEDVRAVAAEIPTKPQVVSLDPQTLGEVLGDVRTVAQAADAKDAGVDLIRDAADRLDRVTLAVRRIQRRPRVVALEWLDPVWIGGHWVPQMIEHAGGEDALGLPGEPSRRGSWAEVEAVQPDVIVAMPCGFDGPRARDEAAAHAEALARTGASRVVAVDAAAYFSRPGPRLVDGVELLGHLLHPEAVPAPAGAPPLPVELARS
jgi:iron complex transport system substrate-binding protein